jgi:MoCo/4Fe-4S cofactor protein with predicted Tat translocation signal
MSSLKKKSLRIWRSSADLEESPEYMERVAREFPTPLEVLPPNSPDRRRFMQVMGASLGLAGLSGCRWKEDKILPLTRRPEDYVPGTTRRFATAMELGGVGVALHATSYEGRPIKIDGNAAHPESLGACSVYQQASILGLYDPDRSDSAVLRQGGKEEKATVEQFVAAMKPALARLRSARGAGLRILAERSSSPSLDELKLRLQSVAPEAKWYGYEAVGTDGPRAGSVLAFGKAHRTHYDFTAADVIVSLDADVVNPTFPAFLRHGREISKRRVAEGAMNRIYAIESQVSMLGSIADHRLPLRAELIKAVAATLDAEISAKASPLPELGAAQAKPTSAALAEAGAAKFIAAVVKDLLGAVGRSVVVAGQHQPAEVHALAHRLNAVLGNVGRTVFYTEDTLASELGDADALAALTGELEAGKVDTLLILGGNPVYDAPADVNFGAALAKAKTSVHLSLYDDETSAKATWHVPALHYLESWGDVRAWDGSITVVQPLIESLSLGLSTLELVALVVGETTAPLELVRRTTKLGEKAFRKALHDGFVAGSAYPRVTPKLNPLTVKFSERELGPSTLGNGQLEVSFVPDHKVYDGRFANNAWLQELPEFMTKLTWDNGVVVSPATGRELGLTDGKPVTLTVGGASVTLPVLFVPGHAPGSLRVSLGYGRDRAGRVAGDGGYDSGTVGVNTYALRTKAAFNFGGGGSLAPSSADLGRLSTTTDIYVIDPIGAQGVKDRLPQIVRSGTLAEYRKEPEFAKHVVHHPPLLNMWQDPVSYDGLKWGMSIDLNKCIGCSSCVTACQAENNIPVVGKKNVSMGREMLWLRVDRYYAGDDDTNPDVVFQPIPCQQCENAPCEQVCPVGATVHSSEGLNDMVYNRCIGTRYCSNNCPYKVRRFNYFNYNLDVIGVTPFTPTDDPKMKVKSMVFNPEVTVRSRGVMEKCTFCVQRIQNTKIKAKNAKRAIADGEIKTACQETCPTDAIIFGDLNDGKAEVTRLQRTPRSYALLGELNNRPRVQYLARIKNTNPELG